MERFRIIEEKVALISQSIYNEVKNKNKFRDGLYTGDFGILLFLTYYAKYTSKDEFISISEEFLEYLLENFSEYDDNVYTFCDGLSGTLYLFLFLKNLGIVEIDFSDYDDVLDKYLVGYMERDIKNHHYDFMHGVIGIGYYFLKKNNTTPINKIIDSLYDSAEKEKNIFKWKSVLHTPPKYDISLSHGCSSIILFLSKVIEKQIEISKSLKMLTGAVNYILSQEREIDLYGSYFPSYFSEDQKPSRLAWCYGDLGIAFSLWYAGNTIRNNFWIEKGLSILLESTKRLSYDETFVVDAGICHGSSGIAMIYRHMYLKTGRSEFLLATHKWIDITLQYSNISNISNNCAGYKSYLDKDKWNNNDFSLLTGISGIGMVLFSYMIEDEQLWDEIFFL